jgi:hypothetical protein
MKKLGKRNVKSAPKKVKYLGYNNTRREGAASKS